MAVQTVQTEPLKEILAELFSLLETLEANNTAVLRFLHDQGIATDEKLTPYLEQAGRASNVKWLAARKRMEHLLTPIQKEASDGDKGKEQAREVTRKEDNQNEERADKTKPDPAQALAGKPVQNSAESKPTKKTADPDEATASGQKTDGVKAAKATSSHQEQRNANPQERESE
jgi:hypothetical protein